MGFRIFAVKRVNKPLISTAGSTRSPLRWEFENPFTTR